MLDVVDIDLSVRTTTEIQLQAIVRCNLSQEANIFDTQFIGVINDRIGTGQHPGDLITVEMAVVCPLAKVIAQKGAKYLLHPSPIEINRFPSDSITKHALW